MERQGEQSTQRNREGIQQSLENLRRLRDEIRVQMHLASLEAKQRWAQLEPKMHQAEIMAHDISDTARKAIEEIVAEFRHFRRSITS